MTTVESICNRALLNLGQLQRIEDLDAEAETDPVVAALAIVYDDTVRRVLEDFPWQFATDFATLVLDAEGDPETDAWARLYRYRYEYPDDCAIVRRFVTRMGRSDPDPPQFETVYGADGKFILTDEPEARAYVEVTRLVDEPARFDVGFIEALAWRLAAEVAVKVTGDPQRRDDCLAKYSLALAGAQRLSVAERRAPPEIDGDFVQAFHS